MAAFAGVRPLGVLAGVLAGVFLGVAEAVVAAGCSSSTDIVATSSTATGAGAGVAAFAGVVVVLGVRVTLGILEGVLTLLAAVACLSLSADEGTTGRRLPRRAAMACNNDTFEDRQGAGTDFVADEEEEDDDSAAAVSAGLP